MLLIGANERERVLTQYCETHVEPQGQAPCDVTFIKGKYRQMLNSHKPTGDPTCQLEVKKAHIFKRTIQERMHFITFDDRAADRCESRAEETEDAEVDDVRYRESSMPVNSDDESGDEAEDQSSHHNLSPLSPPQSSTVHIERGCPVVQVDASLLQNP